MTRSVPRQAFAIFAAMAVLVLAIGALSFFTTRSFESASSKVEHSHEVFAQIDRTFIDVQDAETGERGFVITGDATYLAPYTAAIARVGSDLATLRSVIGNDAEQLQRLDKLDGEVTLRLNDLQQSIQLERDEGARAARESIVTSTGQQDMLNIRSTVDDMRNAEQTLFDQRSNGRDATARNQLLALSALIAMEIGLLGVLALFIRRYVRERRKRAQQAVDLAEAQYRAVGDAIPFGVWATAADGRLSYVSRSFLDFIGLTFEDYRDGGWARLLPAETAAALTAEWDRCRTAGLPFDYIQEFTGADGSKRTVLGRSVPIPSAAGGIAGYAGINLDVSERAAIESALRESEVRYRTLAEALPAMVASTSPDGMAQYHNSRWSEYTGLSPERLAGIGWRDAIHPDDRAAVIAKFEAARASGTEFEADYRILGRFGEYRRHHDHTIPVFGEDRALAMWLSIEIDIEAQKQTEEGLREAAAAKDEFLGLVSHELRTPLTIIVGNARALGRITQLSPEEQANSIADIQGEAERLQRLIENMLTLSRVESQTVVLPEPVLLQRAIPGIVAAHAGGRSIRINVSQDLAPVSAEPLYVEQVMQNLLSNALKYTPPDSEIEVRARDAGAMVSVSVLDRGAGILPEEIDRIFEPFFRSRRTSAQASGVGLGLSVCKRLVEAQGGHMWARPRDGGGTEIGFALPAYLDIGDDADGPADGPNLHIHAAAAPFS